MTDEITFKTSAECRCELVAHTVMNKKTYFHESIGFPMEYGGCDAGLLPVSAARASFGREDKTGDDPKADLKLMKYLADHEHLSVFEHQSATFLIECPLFIRSQIMRHRTGAYNEWSRRYTSEKIGFWIPDKWRKQSSSNKQASTDDVVEWIDTECWEGDPFTDYKRTITGSMSGGVYDLYCAMVDSGICREQARAVLPQSLLTQFYMTMNLRNWVHFLKLRLDSHAQLEVQIVARKIESQLRELWPEAMSVLLPE